MCKFIETASLTNLTGLNCGVKKARSLLKYGFIDEEQDVCRKPG